MSARKCKGCGRKFHDQRSNVVFCLPQCSRIAKSIANHERCIAKLRELQLQLRAGSFPLKRRPVEECERFFRGNAEAYVVAGDFDT
jgi:hypothetical protein